MTNTTQHIEKKLQNLRLALGYQDILWVSGQVFLCRNFTETVTAVGLETIFAQCPYGDLQEMHTNTFRGAFNSARLREVVRNWHQEYTTDHTFPAAGQQNTQDITRLLGLVFLRRDFMDALNAQGLDVILAQECAYGDLTTAQKSAFAALTQQPRLREIVNTWWKTYDQERANGIIAQTSPWY